MERKVYYTILEGGHSMDLNKQQAEFLLSSNFIYKCSVPDCGFYHLYEAADFACIDAVLDAHGLTGTQLIK